MRAEVSPKFKSSLLKDRDLDSGEDEGGEGGEDEDEDEVYGEAGMTDDQKRMRARWYSGYFKKTSE
jgi:hypothetical protein